MQFSKLLDAHIPSGSVREVIDDLLERKRSGVELGEGPVIKEIADMIIQKMEAFDGLVKRTEFTQPWDSLDRYFRQILSTVERTTVRIG